MTGDSTTNIIGVEPGFIAPTTATGIGTDAGAANFRLTATSPCLYMGDNAVVASGDTDMDGVNRIVGAMPVDIGAYESTYLLGLTKLATTPGTQVYPNPAVGFTNVATPVAEGTLTLTNAAGQLLATVPVSTRTTTLHLGNLPRGIYMVCWAHGGTTDAVGEVELR